MWQDKSDSDEAAPKRQKLKPAPRPLLPRLFLANGAGDSEGGTQLVQHELGLYPHASAEKRMSTMGQDHDGFPYTKLEEDKASEDEGEWEVVQPGHPASIYEDVPQGYPASIEGSSGSSGGSQGGKRIKTEVSTSDFQNSRSQILERDGRLVKFQHEKLLAMTADLEVRQNMMKRKECETLARMKQQEERSLELVKKKTDEMQVNIPYLRSW
jgi:hypothetical protein